MNSPGDNSADHPPRGRRPGDSGTREAILAAARAAFAHKGFDRSTVRAIAREAGVDPALVMHYFGSKQGLFMEAMRPPFRPADLLPAIVEGDPAGVGRRLAEFALSQWEQPESRERLLGILRSACSDPAAAAMLRALVERELFAPMARAVGAGDADLRAALAASQIVGLALVRHVLQADAAASADPADLVEWLAPTLQRYLAGPR